MDNSSGAPSLAFPHAAANHPPPLTQDSLQDPLLQNMVATVAATLVEPPSPGAHPQQQMILHHHSQFTTASIIATPVAAHAPLLDPPKKLPQHRPLSSDNAPASPPPPPPPHHSPPRHWSPLQPLDTQRRHKDLDRLEDAQWQVSPHRLQTGPTSSFVSWRDESSPPHLYSPFQAQPNLPPLTFTSRPSHPLARPVVFDRGSYDQHSPFPTRLINSAPHADNSIERQQRTLAWSKGLGSYSSLMYQPGYPSRATRSQDAQSPNRGDHDTQQEQQPHQGYSGDHVHSNGSNVNGNSSSSSSSSAVGKSQNHQPPHPRQRGGHHSTQSQPLPSPQPQSQHQSPHHHHQPQYPSDGNHAHHPSPYSPHSSASVSTPDNQQQYQNYPPPQQQQQQRLKTPPVPMTGSEAHNHHHYDKDDRRSLDRSLVHAEAALSSDMDIERRYDHRPDYSPGYPPDHYPMHRRPLSPPPRAQSQLHGPPPPSQIGPLLRPQSLPRPPLPIYQEEHQEMLSHPPSTTGRGSDHVSRQASLGHGSRADWAEDNQHDRRDLRFDSSNGHQGHHYDERQSRQYQDRDTGSSRSQRGHATPLSPGTDSQGTPLKSHWDRARSPDQAEGFRSQNKPRTYVNDSSSNSNSDHEPNWRTKTRTKEDLKLRFGTDMPKTVDLKSAIETCDILFEFALHFANQDHKGMAASRMEEDDGVPVDPDDRATLQMIRNLAGTMLVGIQHAGSSDINIPSPSVDPHPTEEDLKTQETNGNYTRPSVSASAADREWEETRRFGANPPSNEMVHELAKAATSIFQLAIRIKAWVNMTSEERELDEEINIIRGKRCLFLDEMTPLSMQSTQDLNGGMPGYSQQQQQQQSSNPYHSNAHRGHIPSFGSTNSVQTPGAKRPSEDSLSHPGFTRFGGAVSKRGGGNKMTKLLKTGMENDSDALHQKYRKRAKRTHPLGRCLSCDTTDTPEWRRGPDGARTLCNACGLHYAKLVKRQKQQQLQGEDPRALTLLTEASTSNETTETTLTGPPNGVGAVVRDARQFLPETGPSVLDYSIGARPPPSEHPIDSSGMDEDTIMS